MIITHNIFDVFILIYHLYNNNKKIIEFFLLTLWYKEEETEYEQGENVRFSHMKIYQLE